MDSKFKNVALWGKSYISNVAETLLAIIDLLQHHHANIFFMRDTAEVLPDLQFPVLASSELSQHVDLLIVVGGDGSLLNAAHFAAPQNLPVLGINKGRLGFLTDVLPDKIAKIEAILCGEYIEEQRFLLKADALQEENIALNDIVLLSASGGHMVEFTLYIDSQYVSTYRADGLIIATPTGSTAHALSGGGPILHPNLDAIVLVPMLSHNLSSRPIVVKSSSQIQLQLAETNKQNAQVTYDGQNKALLTPGSVISVSKAEPVLRLLHPHEYNYYETLRVKLHWEQS